MNYGVNLLPPHLWPQTGRHTRHMAAGALVGVFVVCTGLFGWQLCKEQQAKREFDRATQEIQLLLPVIQQTRKNKALKAQIEARTAILARIERERSVEWSDLILQLGQATPDNLWLTELANDVNGLIVVRGGANDIDTVSTYANTLRQVPSIAQVSFVSLTQSEIGEKGGATAGHGPEQRGISFVRYDLSVRLQGGVPK